jgi:hypothetical protein
MEEMVSQFNNPSEKLLPLIELQLLKHKLN